jgi:hypothetical protein
MSKSVRKLFFSFAIIAIMFVSACSPSRSTGGNNDTQENGAFTDQIETELPFDPASANSTDAPPDEFPRTPDPISVVVSLDTDSVVTKSSYDFSFSLKGKTAEGFESTLNLDNKLYIMEADGTLSNAFGTKVTMTPVTSIEGLPFSNGFLIAYQFGPEGLVMAQPGNLFFKVPGKFEDSELIGFAANSDGSDFHMFPINTIYMDYDNTTNIYINIMHFSLYGVAQATLAEIQAQQAHPPVSAASQDEDELAPLPNLNPDPEDLSPLIGKTQLQLLKSHTRMVKSLIDNLSTTKCEQVTMAAYRFNEWQAKVDQVQQTDYFQKLIDTDANALHERFVECARELCPVCMGSQSGDKANKAQLDSMINLATFAEVNSFFNNFDDFAYWRELSSKCSKTAGYPSPSGSTGGELSGDTLPTPTPVGCPL